MTSSITDEPVRTSLAEGSATVMYSAVEVARALGLPHEPTPEQAAVIEAPLAPMLVVAGAGSGKTETMAARVVWLVANGLLAPEQVLGLTFTRKAASELSARVQRRLQTLDEVGLIPPRSNGIPPGADDVSSPHSPKGEVRRLPADPFAGRPTISTYHSYAGSIVSDFGVRLGVEPTARLLTEAATWQLAYEAAVRFDGDVSDFDKTEGSLTSATLNLAGELAEHLVDLTAVDDYLASCITTLEAIPLVVDGKRKQLPGGMKDAIASMRARRVAVQVARRYAQLKASRDAMDFADQIAVAARLASEFADIAAIEQQRYRVVLLDEFQDTSHAQLQLLRSLFSGTAVTAVGDPHQSIYGWRGASATTLSAFRDAFSTGGDPATVLPLATSWRNSQRVLGTANSVAEPLRTRLAVPVERLAQRPDAPEGRVFAARYLTDRDEADAVATWLKDRGAGTEAVSAAVLCRKRSQFRPVMEALEARGVPFEVVGLGGLLLTPEVEDVVALLSVVDDPTRGDHLMRLLLGPIVRLGAADLDGLWTYARERQRIHAPRDGEAVKDQALDVVDTATLAEALEDLPRPGWTGPRGQTISRTALERLAVLAGMIREMRSLAAAPLPDLIAAAEQVLGLDIEVAARPGYYLSAARAHLDAFVDVAAEFSASADRVSLGAFLAWLEAAEHHERGLETRASDSAAGPVSIMTIHAAKGLEWDVVAVPGLVEATFPTHRSQPSGKSGRWTIGSQTGKGWLGSVTEAGIPHALRGDRAGLPDLDWRSLRDSVEAANAWQEFCEAMGEHAMEEERRLAYVAFTRAKEQLLLTCSVWGPQKSPRVTSRFLVDALAGAGLLEADPEERWRRLDEGRLPLGAADAGVTVLRWEPMPPVEEFVKPERTSERAAVWPVEGPSESAAYERRELAAAAIVQAMAAEPWQGVAPDDETRVLTERILRQQTQERRPSEQLPALEAISASNVVAAARSPQAFAASLRRPMPTAPNPAARRGTRFHAFVEQHFGRAAMLDWDELPGSADAEDHGGEEAALATMKAHFLASEWADRAPVAIETPVETVLPTVHGPVAVRGRIDAVFERPGGGVTIVDWKSGAPGAEGDLAARAVQLGVYALAWERIHRLAPGSVDVAFYFAATGETVRPPLPTQEQIVHVLDSIQAQHSR